MGGLLKFIGLVLVLGGLAILGLIYFPVAKQEIRYRTLQATTRNSVTAEVTPQSLDFGLVIPKIGVNTVIFDQVDPTNPAEYLPILAQGVAQSVKSVYPGQDGTIFLFAHSADSPLNITRYNAVFYLLSKLEPGDSISIFYRRVEYRYRVDQVRVIAPELVGEYWTYAEGDRRLILQTCHPAGTTINRLLVIAEEA